MRFGGAGGCASASFSLKSSVVARVPVAPDGGDRGPPPPSPPPLSPPPSLLGASPPAVMRRRGAGTGGAPRDPVTPFMLPVVFGGRGGGGGSSSPPGVHPSLAMVPTPACVRVCVRTCCCVVCGCVSRSEPPRVRRTSERACSLRTIPPLTTASQPTQTQARGCAHVAGKAEPPHPQDPRALPPNNNV
jgi:hypothetical protein